MGWKSDTSMFGKLTDFTEKSALRVNLVIDI